MQVSCHLEPAVPRPRLYAGADQPARLSLEIDAIKHQGQLFPVVSQDILQMPFCAITRLARSDGTHLPKVLVVAPLSSHFAILLRDLVLGLLPWFQVFITDWVNARHVPVEQGPFDLEENTSYIIEAMRVLAPELNVIALCQAGVPALVATAYHSDNDQGCAPCSLVLMAAPIDPGSQSDACFSSHQIAHAFLVRAQRHRRGNVAGCGQGPSRLSGLPAAVGSVGLFGPSFERRRRVAREVAHGRRRGPGTLPLPRSLFGRDGPSRRGLSRYHASRLPGAHARAREVPRPQPDCGACEAFAQRRS